MPNTRKDYRCTLIARAFELAMQGASIEELAAALGIEPERAREIVAIQLVEARQ